MPILLVHLWCISMWRVWRVLCGYSLCVCVRDGVSVNCRAFFIWSEFFLIFFSSRANYGYVYRVKQKCQTKKKSGKKKKERKGKRKRKTHTRGTRGTHKIPFSIKRLKCGFSVCVVKKKFRFDFEENRVLAFSLVEVLVIYLRSLRSIRSPSSQSLCFFFPSVYQWAVAAADAAAGGGVVVVAVLYRIQAQTCKLYLSIKFNMYVHNIQYHDTETMCVVVCVLCVREYITHFH